MQIQNKVFLIFFDKVLILNMKNLLVFANTSYLLIKYFLHIFAKKRLWQQLKQKT